MLDFETNETISIKGYVKKIRFKNEENGFCILIVEKESDYSDVVITGKALNIYEGAYIVASGTFIEHPKFGKQLKAITIIQTPPSDIKGVEKYLSSGLLPGIGIKTAQKIIALYGKNAIEKILQDPSSLKSIKGLNQKKVDEIYNTLQGQKSDGDIIRFLIEHNINQNLANLIYKKYGEKSIEVVSSNPYKLCSDIVGIGFLKADDIAFKMGFSKDDPRRIKAGILYTLEKSLDDGNCFLEEKKLEEHTKQILKTDTEFSINQLVEELIIEKFLISRNGKLFLPAIDFAENFIAKFIVNKILAEKTPLISENFINNTIPKIEAITQIHYTEEQINALKIANNNRLALITGGPGCGKTTLINLIARIFSAAGKSIKLAAPTGKAAQRLGSVCNMKAQTIHRLLKYDPTTFSFTYNLDKQINADIFIIDESSMIDVSLAKDLFSAIPNHATLIMVGDKDQLPPVGPGKVYSDLLSCNFIKKISLSYIFRRDITSKINDIAFDINNGIVPKIPIPDGITKTDAYFIPKESQYETANLIEKLVLEQIPEKFNIPSEDIVVLTPMNKGPLGTINLNQRIQKTLNPIEMLDSEQEIIINNNSFRLNDRVCQRVNNYNLGPSGVFNGDTGIITSINSHIGSVVVTLWNGQNITYQKNDLSELQLAYALSVHRSQGSEIPCVVLALHMCHFNLLERQLIYTAITRAKKLLIIVGEEKALKMAVNKQNSIKRKCSIIERIEDLLKFFGSVSKQNKKEVC